MVRGKTLFICTECKKVFMAPDVEYGAMAYSVRCLANVVEADARCLYSNCWLIRCIKAYGKR